MRIQLHVGAHKTATTFIQCTLEANLRHLNEAGVGFIPLRKLRPLLARHIGRSSDKEARIDDHLDEFFSRAFPGDMRGIVISEENLLGTCGPFLRSGRPYAHAPQRLSHMRRFLRGHDVTMFMAIRSYDSFTASAYCEGLRNLKSFVRFNRFRRALDREAMRWPQMIARLQDALGTDQVKVWRYEDFRPNAEAILDALAFGVATPLRQETTRRAERPSFSQAAADALELIAKSMGRHVASKLIVAVDNALPKGPGFPAFSPWSEQELEEFASMYAEDCAAIPKDMWLVGAGASTSAKQMTPIERGPTSRSASDVMGAERG